MGEDRAAGTGSNGRTLYRPQFLIEGSSAMGDKGKKDKNKGKKQKVRKQEQKAKNKQSKQATRTF